jgi:hypothetical protein
MNSNVNALSIGPNRILVNYFEWPEVDDSGKPVTFPSNDQLVKVSNWVKSVEIINVNTMQRIELSYSDIERLANLVNDIKGQQIPPISIEEYYNMTA